MQDLANFFYILIILLILQRYYRFSMIVFVLLIVHLFMIFVFNDFVFSAKYMPDQFKYLSIAQHIRSFEFDLITRDQFNRVFLSSLFFALFPIPFINSIYSIAMINFLLYLVVFIFAYKKRIFNNKFGLYFYLLFPSLTLYSSVALRDMLIFIIMFSAMYYILHKRYLLGLILSSMLIFVKIQNFLILVVVLVVNYLLNKKMKIKEMVFLFIFCFIAFMFFKHYFSIDMLNHYAGEFYKENADDMIVEFIPFASYFDVLIQSLPKALYFMMRPLPWIEGGMFQYIQFVENMVVASIIIYILYKNTKYQLWKLEQVKFLNIFLFFGLVIYGLVIYNSGTAVRYKFTFTAIYIIYSFYYIYKYKLNILNKGMK